MAAQRLDERGDGRCFLADSYIDAINRVARLEAAALVDDRVDGDRRLAGLTVADNQLALSAADGNHRIDGLQARLQGLVHRLAEDDARSLALQRHLREVAADRTLAVERLAQRVDDTAEHRLAHADRGRAARAAHEVALLEAVGGPEQHGAHVVLFEIHHHGPHAVVELQQFVRFGVPQSEDAHHAVADLQHRAHLGELRRKVDALQFGKEYIRDFR